MRIVLDTNVLVRATPGRTSAAREVLLLALRAPHVLILSPFLLAELSRVLRYERVRGIHKLTEEEISNFVDDLQRNAFLVNVPMIAPNAVVPNDPDDDPIVATAIDGTAEVLCSLDRHLNHLNVIQYCQSHGVEILRDVELLKRLRA